MNIITFPRFTFFLNTNISRTKKKI